MLHLNLARLSFTERAFIRTNRDNRKVGREVPAWSFYESMEHSGHRVGEYFSIKIPESIKPIMAHPIEETHSREKPALILPPNSFNVVLPFKIVPAVYPQDGVLIFGRTELYQAEIVEGRELILASESNFFPRDTRTIFAAVLKANQRIVIHHKVWINSRNPSDWGSKDTASIFTAKGYREMNWREFKSLDLTDDTKKKIDSGKWRLI